MRALALPWSGVFCLVCEVALICNTYTFNIICCIFYYQTEFWIRTYLLICILPLHRIWYWGPPPHTSEGPWPCCYEGPRISSKGHINCLTYLVCWSLHQAYFLELGLIQISVEHETIFVICHVGIHVNFSFMIILWALRPSPSSAKWTWVVVAFSTSERSWNAMVMGL